MFLFAYSTEKTQLGILACLVARPTKPKQCSQTDEVVNFVVITYSDGQTKNTSIVTFIK